MNLIPREVISGNSENVPLSFAVNSGSLILLIDVDHTLYPATAPTLTAIDARITLFIQERLGLSWEVADLMRRTLCTDHGTTLKGLHLDHGTDPEGYFDFIQAVEGEHLPHPDLALREWLLGLSIPAYLFTNARRDWAERILAAMQLGDLLGADRPLLGIFDIVHGAYAGKPNDDAYAAVERDLKAAHGPNICPMLLDDRLDNLDAAHSRGWKTGWIRADEFIPDLSLSENLRHPRFSSLRDLTLNLG
jgi:putative hydrolase of the HAD superfamily